MKKLLLTALALACAGCAGLNVSWVATASYNTPALTQSIMSPGVEKEAPATTQGKGL